MNSKAFWQSKIFWLSVVVIAGGIVEFIAGLPSGASIMTILAGVINIIFRFLTNQPIAGTPSAKPK